jgi:hypothetical protein
MSTPVQETIEPEQDRPAQIINVARANRLAIRCIGAAGEQTDMVYSGVNELWVICRRLAEDRDSWVVDQRVNESLRNIIKCCRPDVELIEESDSLLAPEEPDDG